jgi:hypothetical protein
MSFARGRAGFGELPPCRELQQLALTTIDLRYDGATQCDPARVLCLPALEDLTMVVDPSLTSATISNIPAESLALQMLAIHFPLVPAYPHAITIGGYASLLSKTKDLERLSIERGSTVKCVGSKHGCSQEQGNSFH